MNNPVAYTNQMQAFEPYPSSNASCLPSYFPPVPTLDTLDALLLQVLQAPQVLQHAEPEHKDI